MTPDATPVRPRRDGGVATGIDLHIETLVLEGVASVDHDRVGEAVQRELARLLGEWGMPPLVQDLGLTHLDGGEFPTAPQSGPEAIGALVAAAVHARLRSPGLVQ